MQRFSKELFKEQIEIGESFEDLVLQKLLASDIPAIKPKKPESDFTKYQKDILVSPDYVIEVKSRNLNFWGPSSYPFEDALLETVYGWEQKDVKPRAIVIVSQRTGAMLAVSVPDSFPYWIKKWQDDSLRGIRSYEYSIPRTHLREIDELIEWLQKNYLPKYQSM